THPPERFLIMSDQRPSRRHSPETRKKISEATKKALASPEVREKMSQSARQRWARMDEEKKSSHGKRMRAGHTEESELRAARTRAERLGYTLIPHESEDHPNADPAPGDGQHLFVPHGRVSGLLRLLPPGANFLQHVFPLLCLQEEALLHLCAGRNRHPPVRHPPRAAPEEGMKNGEGDTTPPPPLSERTH